MTETVLDMRGLLCPLPVLRARKAMRPLAAGARVRVLATDPGTVRDFAAMCQATGDRLLSQHAEGGDFIFVLEKAADR